MANIDAVFGFMFTNFIPSQQVSKTCIYEISQFVCSFRKKFYTSLIYVLVLEDSQNIFFGGKSGK